MHDTKFALLYNFCFLFSDLAGYFILSSNCSLRTTTNVFAIIFFLNEIGCCCTNSVLNVYRMNQHQLDDTGKELLLTALYIMLLTVVLIMIVLGTAMYRLVLRLFYLEDENMTIMYFAVLLESTFARPFFQFSTNCARAEGGNMTMEILLFFILIQVCGQIVTILILKTSGLSENAVALSFCLWMLFAHYFSSVYHYSKMFSGYNVSQTDGAAHYSIKLNFRITALFTSQDRKLMYKEFFRFFLTEFEQMAMKTAILVLAYRYERGTDNVRKSYLLFSYQFLLYYMQMAHLINYSTITFSTDFNPRSVGSFEELADVYIQKSRRLFVWSFLAVSLELLCLPFVQYYFYNHIEFYEEIRRGEYYSRLFVYQIGCLCSSLFVSPYYASISFFQQAEMLVPVLISLATLALQWVLLILQACFEQEHPNILRFIMYQELQKLVQGIVLEQWIIRILAHAVATERLEKDQASSSAGPAASIVPSQLKNGSACTQSTGSIFMVLNAAQ